MACRLFGDEPLSEPTLVYCGSNKLQWNASENIVFEIAGILSTGVWGKAYFNVIKETCSFLSITRLKANRLYTVHKLGNIKIEEYHQRPYEPHDDVIKWKHFPRYWQFVWGIHRSPMNSPHKSHWSGALMFSLISAWKNGWENNGGAEYLRRHSAHYDVIIMQFPWNIIGLFTPS